MPHMYFAAKAALPVVMGACSAAKCVAPQGDPAAPTGAAKQKQAKDLQSSAPFFPTGDNVALSHDVHRTSQPKPKGLSMPHFLPMTQEELRSLGIDRPDFVIVTGDAYVDHPSFGTAIIGRVLEADGYTVGIISQPDYKNLKSFLTLGIPKYAFLVNSGNIDSMVNHYTAAKRRRRDDAYTAGGMAGARPDRAVTVYSNAIRAAAPGVPVIIGGIEASLRRFAHYDYWDNAVRRSVLLDSGADLLIYGMGESPIREVARRLESGQDLNGIRSTVSRVEQPEGDGIILPDYDTLKYNKKAYMSATVTQYREQDAVRGKPLYQQYGTIFIKQNPPYPPLPQDEFDRVYELPYMYAPHPSYTEHVPAIEEVEFSIIQNRGCFGCCSFCALTLHQSRAVTSRSKESLVNEAKAMVHREGFKGYIHDVGGPTANFRATACKKQITEGVCPDRRCLAPTPCPNLDVSHAEFLDILGEMRAIKGVKKVFVRSGLRYDFMMLDSSDRFFRELTEHHISGQLKVAPEHIAEEVLISMGKPPQEVFDSFTAKYKALNKKLGKKQFLVPYLMSSHPASTLNSAIKLAIYLKESGLRPEQVQDFYPTPGTMSTAMYYTETDEQGNALYVAKDQKDKDKQRALLQFFRPNNHELVRQALTEAGRTDLIGRAPHCLVPPGRTDGKAGSSAKGASQGDRGARGASHGDKSARSAQQGDKNARSAPHGDRGVKSALHGDKSARSAPHGDRGAKGALHSDKSAKRTAHSDRGAKGAQQGGRGAKRGSKPKK